MMLLGVATTGLAYSHALGVTNAVREGARFGATANAGVPATWSNDTISRVRATQFDDPSGKTAICVQLWRVAPSGGTQVAGDCHQGDGSVSPPLALPTGPTVRPAVPAGLPTNACVVRVIAARNFTINIALAKWDRVRISHAVTRFERTDVVPTCL